MDDTVMLSASEAGITESHVLSHQLVTAARGRRLPAYLLQHGVRIEQFDSSISFASDHVLAWSDERRAFLEDERRLQLGLETSNGAISPGAFIFTGGSRLAEAVSPGEGSVQARLARPSADLHWVAHAQGGATLDALGPPAARHREWRFGIKPHPLESADEYSDLLGGNIADFEDQRATLTEHHTPCVLREADVAAPSRSCLLVEAAVAGCKIVQYAADNPYRYLRLMAWPLEQLSAAVFEHAPNQAIEVATGYAEADHRQFRIRRLNWLAKPPQHREGNWGRSRNQLA